MVVQWTMSAAAAHHLLSTRVDGASSEGSNGLQRCVLDARAEHVLAVTDVLSAEGDRSLGMGDEP